MQASVGRIVHYSDELSTCNAAIVTGVLDDLEPDSRGQVTLMVFPSSSPGEALAAVPHSATPAHLHTWHWPEGTREHQAVQLPIGQCPGCPCGWNGPHPSTDEGRFPSP